MATLADPYFDRWRAHRKQCPRCKAATNYEDTGMCRLGAALMRSWLEAEVRVGGSIGGWRIQRVPEGEAR